MISSILILNFFKQGSGTNISRHLGRESEFRRSSDFQTNGARSYAGQRLRRFGQGIVYLNHNLYSETVLISKRMVQDHMPDNVLDALDKVLFCLS